MVSRKIGIIIGVIIVITIVSIFSVYSFDDSNKIETDVSTNNESQNMTDSNGQKFYINDEGRKIIVIEARDSLSIGD